MIGSATLYHGDCEDVIPTLPRVDAVITSPPYNLGNTTGGGFSRSSGAKWHAAARSSGIGNGYGDFDDNMPHDEYVEWQKRILRALWAQLADDGAIFYNHKPRVLDGVLVTPLAYNPELPVRQIIIWARSGGMNFSPTFYLPTHEWIVLFAKPDFRLRDKAASGAGDVWRIHQAESDNEHPAPFPVRLPEMVLETTKAQTVLDPFMGSATTGLACQRLGRSFIGIEREKRWFELACRRLEDGLRQERLFA